MSETSSGDTARSGLVLDPATVKPSVLDRLRKPLSNENGRRPPPVVRTRGLVSADLVERLRLTNVELAREEFLASREEPPRVPASMAVGKWCRQAHNHLRSDEMLFKDKTEAWRLKRETAEAILSKDIARRHFRTKPKYETGTAHPPGTHDLHAPVKREPLLVLLETRKLLHMSELILAQPGAERVGQKPAGGPASSQGSPGVTATGSQVPALHATLYALARYGGLAAKPPPETPWPPGSEAPSSYTSTFAGESSRSLGSSPSSSPSHGAPSEATASTSAGASSGTRTVSEEGGIRVDSSLSSVGGQRAPTASSSETHTVSTERSSEEEQAEAYSQDFGSEPGVSGEGSGAGSGGGSAATGQRSEGQEQSSHGGSAGSRGTSTAGGSGAEASGEYSEELGGHTGAASTPQGDSSPAEGAEGYEEDFEEEGPNNASRHEDVGEEEGYEDYEDTFDEEGLEEEEEEASGDRSSSARSSRQGDSEEPASEWREGISDEDVSDERVSEEGISEAPSSHHDGASLLHSGSGEESRGNASGRSGSVQEEYSDGFGSQDGASLLHSGGSGGGETVRGSSVQEEDSEGFGSQDGASLLHSGGSGTESSVSHAGSGVRTESYAETFEEERSSLPSRHEDGLVVEAEASSIQSSQPEQASLQHSQSGASGGMRSGSQGTGGSHLSGSQVSGSGGRGSPAAGSQRSGSGIGGGVDASPKGSSTEGASSGGSQASSPSLRLQAGASGSGSSASAAPTPRLAAFGGAGEAVAVARVPVPPELAAHVPSYSERLPVGVQLQVAGDALAEVLAGSRSLFAWAESLLGPCASPAGKGGAAANGGDGDGSGAEFAAGDTGGVGG